MGFCHLEVTRPWQIPILVPRGQERLGIRLGTALLLAARPRPEDAEIFFGGVKAQPPRASPLQVLWARIFWCFRAGRRWRRRSFLPRGGFTPALVFTGTFRSRLPAAALLPEGVPRGLGPPGAVSHPALGKSRGKKRFFGCPPDARNSWKQRSNKEESKPCLPVPAAPIKGSQMPLQSPNFTKFSTRRSPFSFGILGGGEQRGGDGEDPAQTSSRRFGHKTGE